MPELKDVFISYGRQNSQDFASRLYKRLEEADIDAWYDFINIPKGEDFQERIYRGIENAHNFVFIISPHANQSEYCLKEIEHALKWNKRIIPILHIEEALEQIHPEIARLNWVYARETTNDEREVFAVDNFETAFLEIAEVIEHEKEFVQLHTKLLKKAITWNKNQRSGHFLLTGKHRFEAEKWLLNNIHKPDNLPCQPTSLHSEFICESRKNAENLMTDTFISYADEDKSIHEQVRKHLTRYLITSWAHYLDIRKGEEFDQAILEGIEKANNVLYFISKKSVQSIYCHKELAYASKHNKRIIPLLIEPVPESDFPEQIKGKQFIDFTDNVKENDYLRDFGALIKELNVEKSYHEQHKIILSQALKWKRQNKNASILLRGFNLQSALSFLKTGERQSHPPTKLHVDFIEESKAKTAQLNTEVFISYSRTDGDFARKLNDELQQSGKTTWFDQESIAAAAADFQEEIYKGIAGSDNFLFVISEKSITSEHCAGEVEHALKCGKRFITLLIEKPESDMHEALSKVNWINFRDNDFHIAFGELLRTLDTDRIHVVQHTKWGQHAGDWLAKDRTKDLLLRGSECLLAYSWLEQATNEQKIPHPTPLHKEYIEASVTFGKAEQKRKAGLIKKLRIYLVLAVIAFVSTMVFGIYAMRLKVIADEEKDKAIKSEQETKQREQEVLAAKQELDSLYYVLSVINIKYEELLAITEKQQLNEIENRKELLTTEIKRLQEGIHNNQLEKTIVAQEDIQAEVLEEKEAQVLEKDKNPPKPKTSPSRSITIEPVQEDTLLVVQEAEEVIIEEASEALAEKERVRVKGSMRKKVEKSLQEAKEEVKEAFKAAENTYLVTNITGSPKYEDGTLVKKGDRIKPDYKIIFENKEEVIQLVSPQGRFIYNNIGLSPVRNILLKEKK